MAQPNKFNPAQFLISYYTTYVYDRKNIASFYEKSAMIYRQSWQTNFAVPIIQCSDQLFFSKEGDHITVLDYTIVPLQYAFLYIINGSIDSDGMRAYFNQVLQVQFFGYYHLIVADYCSFTGPPNIVLGVEYYEVPDPNLQSNEVPNASYIPKQDEKVNNQNEQAKQKVSPIQQQQTQNQSQPQSQQHPQQHHDYPSNGGRGRETHRFYNKRGRGQNRNDGGSRDLSYGSPNKYTFNPQSTQPSNKYVPPTSQINQNNK